MTDVQPTDLVTVSLAAKQCSTPGNEIRVQKLHKGIRDGEIPEYIDPRTQKRMVSLQEVRNFLAGKGSSSRGRPKGTYKAIERVVTEGDFIIRAAAQEVVRHVDVVTSTKTEYFSTRGIVDCAPDVWTGMMRNGTAKELLEQDKMFVLDRWALIKLLQESFVVTGENDIAERLQHIADDCKEASDLRRKEREAQYKEDFRKLKEGWMIEQGMIDDPNKKWDEEDDQD